MVGFTVEERRQQVADGKIYGTHIFIPIEYLTGCPVSAAEAAALIPKYSRYRLDDIDDAIQFLQDVKKFKEEYWHEKKAA